MSGTVDDEVVRMRFDNNAFERGVSTTLGTLAKLKNSLNFTGADKGLDQIEAKASKFNLSGMSNGIDGVSKKFLALSTIAITALSNITNRAVNAGISMVKSFTLDPIKEGFTSYETQINAAKTILSNTGAKLPQVEAQLSQLQTYANQTVYSFQDMAQNIGTFTAAGVKLVPATSAIKGMGNTAALSGANVQQLNSAMYQMSQAMSSGVIRLQDWNSLSNANMGGQNIQKVLMATAGTIKDTGPKMDAAIKKYGNFRNSLTDGWLTADVFSKSMGIMAGTVDKATGKTVAFSVAQLRAKGYTQAQAVELHRLSQAAIESATQIRTYTQLTQALKEEVGTAWSTVFKTIFGNVDGATKLFTALHTTLENAFTSPIYALNNFLVGVKKLGGITIFIDAIKLAFHTLGAILDTVKGAFREVFPKQSAQNIVDMIKSFHVFIENLMPMPATLMRLQHIFAGLFAILDIGKQVFMGVVHMIGQLFGAVTQGSGGFLKFASHMGIVVLAFDRALKQGDLLTNFFAIIGNVLSIPIHLLGVVGNLIAQLFSRFDRKNADNMSNSVIGAGNALSRVADITKRVSDWFAGLSGKIKPGVDAVVHAFQSIGSAIAKGLGSAGFSNILSTIQTGLLAGIVLLLKKFLSNGFHLDIGGGFLGKAGEALDGLTGNLKAMQMQLKAKALLEIAAAIGIIAAAVVALSMVDSQKLQVALKAMAVGFGELLGAMAILTKISGSAGFVKIPIMAASLDLLAVAILLLTAAVAAMAQLSWQELEKGLTAVGVLLAALSAASFALSANSAGMIRSGVGIAAIAVALNLLYFAVKNFASMSWKDMATGLGMVSASLIALAVIMRAMPTGMVAQGAALVLIAGALQLLYLAIKQFATVSWGDMVHGLAGVAGALTAIALGMKLMPPGMIAQSIALNLIGLALQSIARAMADMGKMSWKTIGKGLTGLAGALLILAVALDAMTGTLAGAAALLVVSAALHLFVPAMMALASMSWGDILKSLGALALAFGVIGVAGALMTPVIPALLALGVALGLVGVAMLAFGAGASLLGIGLTAIAASGGAAIGVLLSGLKGLIVMLPLIATNLATALVSFITIIGSHAPQIIGAFVSILNGLLQAVPKIMPSLIVAFGSIVQGLLTVIAQNAPSIIAAGMQLLMDLLNGIKNNIGQIVTTVATIIVNFLNALASNMGRIINAGVNLLAQFLIGIASALGRMPGIVLQVVAAFLTSLFSNFGKIFSGGAQLLGKLVGGILGDIGKMASAAISLIARFLSGLAGKMGDLVSAGAHMVGKLVDGILSAIGNFASNLWNAGWNLIKHIVDGALDGIKSMAGKIAGGLKGMISGGLSSIGGMLGIGGPSQVFHDIGAVSIGGGLINGLNSMNKKVADATANMGHAGVLAMRKTLNGLGKAISETNIDYNPTISPVLDLTQFTKDASQMGSLLGSSQINPTLSSIQAANISNQQNNAAQEAAATTPTAAPAPIEFKFEQTNNSPKALSTVEIYRQTNNQLSQVKHALGLVTTSPPQ